MHRLTRKAIAKACHAHNAWLYGGALLLLLVVLGMLYFFNPAQQVLMPKCVFKMVTGYDCPGCGFQRAAHAALHGNFAEAARYNLFLLLALPLLAATVISDLLLRGARQQRWQRFTHNRFVLGGYLVCFFAWWIVRNIWGI